MERRTFIRGSLGLGALAGLAALTGCGLTGQATASGNDKTIKLIVTESAPYQEPTKLAQKALEADGWKVEVKYVTDIVQPNFAVANGEFDANYFQHASYLAQFTKDKNLAVEPAFYMYGSPGGIYSQKHKSIDDLPTGAKIAIPVDPSNNGRALAMLAKAGVIEGRRGQERHSPVAKRHPREPQEGHLRGGRPAVVVKDAAGCRRRIPLRTSGRRVGSHARGRTALRGNADALPFICLVAAKPGFAETEKGKALEKAYHSDEVRDWFKNYIGGVCPLHGTVIPPPTARSGIAKPCCRRN